MNRVGFKKIATRDFTDKVHINSITEIEGLAISRKSSFNEEFIIDFQYPYILDGFILLFCTKGTGRVRININEYVLKERTLMVATAGSILQLLEHTEDCEVDYVLFTFDFISDIKLHTQLSDIAKLIEQEAILSLETEEYLDLITIHRLMVKQFDQKDALREYIVKSLLHTIIYKVLQLFSLKNTISDRKIQTREEEIYTQFISLLFEHYKTERSISFYAEKLHLTPKYFSKMIGKADSLSASEWIDEMVIVGAKALLKSSSYSVAQISEELNFANPSFFSAYFKKRVGVTPLQYRGN